MTRIPGWADPDKADKKRADDPEHREQVDLFSIIAPLRAVYPALRLLHAVPNAGKRSYIVGARMKAEGLVRGAWDVHLPVARKGYHSLSIEMKVAPNELTPEQAEWQVLMEAEGNLCVVCWSGLEAVEVVLDYMDIHLPEWDGRPSGLGAGAEDGGEWREVITDPAQLWDSIKPGEQVRFGRALGGTWRG